MKVLVTGSNGFLGGAIIKRLIAHGERNIRCFVRPGSDRHRLTDIQVAHPEIDLEIFEGTLATLEGAEKSLEGVGQLYHVAAGMSGPAADLFLASVVSSKNLLEAMVKRNCFIPTVLISSFGVYQTSSLKKGSILDENSPLETHPELRDFYSFAKLRQERLFWEYHRRYKLPLTVIRPGVIYGQDNPGPSARVGLSIGPIFLFLGGNNIIPLTFVDNCAEAAVIVGQNPSCIGQIYNVHDDNLPTCKQFLSRYRTKVRRLRCIKIPYALLMAISKIVLSYHEKSKGQLPAIFTPYKTQSSWKSLRFSNAKLKSTGWKPLVGTETALESSLKRPD